MYILKYIELVKNSNIKSSTLEEKFGDLRYRVERKLCNDGDQKWGRELKLNL